MYLHTGDSEITALAGGTRPTCSVYHGHLGVLGSQKGAHVLVVLLEPSVPHTCPGTHGQTGQLVLTDSIIPPPPPICVLTIGRETPTEI